jgi:hypothetical protein
MGCVMFGRERDQAGVLIELKASYAIDPSNEQDVISIRNTLWFVNLVFFFSHTSDITIFSIGQLLRMQTKSPQLSAEFSRK